MMRVRPLLPTARHAAIPLRRGAAFDEFDGRRWTKGKVDFTYRYGESRYATARAAPDPEAGLG